MIDTLEVDKYLIVIFNSPLQQEVVVILITKTRVPTRKRKSLGD